MPLAGFPSMVGDLEEKDPTGPGPKWGSCSLHTPARISPSHHSRIDPLIQSRAWIRGGALQKVCFLSAPLAPLSPACLPCFCKFKIT